LQRSVAELMRRQVVTTREEQNIVALVPLLADLGLHHIPVVNPQQQLTGMISQSDLIAALYQLQLQQDALAKEQ